MGNKYTVEVDIMTPKLQVGTPGLPLPPAMWQKGGANLFFCLLLQSIFRVKLLLIHWSNCFVTFYFLITDKSFALQGCKAASLHADIDDNGIRFEQKLQLTTGCCV